MQKAFHRIPQDTHFVGANMASAKALEQDEKVIDKIISAISDCIQLEPIQAVPVPILSFPGFDLFSSFCHK